MWQAPQRGQAKHTIASVDLKRSQHDLKQPPISAGTAGHIHPCGGNPVEFPLPATTTASTRKSDGQLGGSVCRCCLTNAKTFFGTRLSTRRLIIASISSVHDRKPSSVHSVSHLGRQLLIKLIDLTALLRGRRVPRGSDHHCERMQYWSPLGVRTACPTLAGSC